MWKGKFLYTVKAYVILPRAHRVVVLDSSLVYPLPKRGEQVVLY